jgi:cytochrome P450 family 142 subfamily A polypeptide 1
MPYVATVATQPEHPDIRLVDGAFWARDPQAELTWLREHAPVYWDETSGLWGVARYEDVVAVSKDPHTYSNAGGSRPDTGALLHMIDMDDPRHRRRRGLVNKGFTLRRVAAREARIREIAIELIERNARRREFDFVMDLAAWLPLIVIGDMLGVEPSAYAKLLEWSDLMLKGTGGGADATLRATEAWAEYCDYQLRVIADRRSRPQTDDLVSILVHAEMDGERLDDETILAEALLILIGGDETTRHVITGGMYQLFRHPAQRRLLEREPGKIPTAVEEMLRWVTPIRNMNRTATRDVVIGGREVRRGDKLLLLYPSANRDERVFREPQRFDVERTPNEHLAFGHAAHFCLGASLARLELRVFFEELLSRLPTLELATAEAPPLRVSNFIVGFEELPVRVS